MFLSPRVLGFGFRKTLQLLQDNVTSMQNLKKPMVKTNYTQQTNFSISKKICNLAEELDKGEELKQPIGKIEVKKLQLSFTCKKCNTRNHNRMISKLAYEKGVVIVRCDGCKNNHLIADNLGWFGGSECRNIETMLKQRGETVQRIRDDSNGYFEAVAKEELSKIMMTLRTQDLESRNMSKEEFDNKSCINDQVKSYFKTVPVEEGAKSELRDSDNVGNTKKE